MAVVGELVVAILGSTAGLTSALGSAEAQLKGFGAAASTHGNVASTALRNVGIAAAAAGVATLGFAAVAVKAAADFQEEMAKINTIAHLTPRELELVGLSIRALSVESGTSLPDLTHAFYDLLSAGVQAKDAMNVLRLANTLSIGALSTTDQAVDLLTTAINSYHLTVAQAAVATDQFALAVQDGKVTADQIALTFSDIAPIAKTAGVGIDEIAASYAFLTAKGLPAAEVTTQMNRAIVELLKPHAALIALQKETGINFAELAGEKGLVVALETMREAADRLHIPFQNLFGRIEGFKFALATTGPFFAGYENELRKMHSATGTAAAEAAERMHTFDRISKEFGATVQSILIDVGNDLLPLVTTGLTELGAWVSLHGTDIENFVRSTIAFGREAVTWAGRAIGVFNGLPDWLKTVLIGGVVADRVLRFTLGFDPILAGAHFAGGALGGLSSILASTKPVPVFVTNQGFGGPGGAGGPGAGPGAGPGLVGGLLAPGLGTLLFGASLPLILFDLIPRLFPGRAQPGAGLGSQPALQTTTAAGTVGSLTVAEFTGLMPSFGARAAAAGAAPVVNTHDVNTLAAVREGNAHTLAFQSQQAAAAAAARGAEARADAARAHISQTVGLASLAGNSRIDTANQHLMKLQTETTLERVALTGWLAINHLYALGTSAAKREGGGLPGEVLATAAGGAGTGGKTISRFQSGGMVPGIGPQLAIVHGGETVLPVGAGGQVINLTNVTRLEVDGDTLAEIIERRLFHSASNFSSGFGAMNPVTGS